MGTYFSDRDYSLVKDAENAFHWPIPPQGVSDREFNPPPQTAQQRELKVRVKKLADAYATQRGLVSRDFLMTSSCMAAAFLAMNSVYGKMFVVSETEAADAAMATERAESLKKQIVFDVQMHSVGDECSQEGFFGFLQEGADGWKNGLDLNSTSFWLHGKKWCGERTPYFTARRNGRLKPCGGSKYRKTCKRSAALQPLGPADGMVKNQIPGLNSAPCYGRIREDEFSPIKRDYEPAGKLAALRDIGACDDILKRA